MQIPMHLFLLILGIITLVAYLLSGIEVTLGGRKLLHLDAVAPIPGSEAPRVSVVVPACNEERGIEAALQSVLHQDYPDFEVIAVDDRSTDSTGAILDRLSQSNPGLKVVHIENLPPGWLGKNHALHEGARQAGGAYILFTDADVVMKPSVLRRAIAFMQSQGIDHLCVAPLATVRGFLAKSFLGTFAMLFSLHTKPWKVKDPKSPYHIGIGAFNLVRAAPYREIGGHGRIAMRPDDDMKLGKLLKLSGYRQDLLFGTRLLSVEWYHSFGEMRRGLMKNLFASTGYNPAFSLAAILLQILFLIWPFIAIFIADPQVRIVNGLICLTLWVLFVVNAGMVGIDWWWCFAMPVGAAVGVYLQLRSMVLTLANGGIEWRGTRYPLAELRANRL